MKFKSINGTLIAACEDSSDYIRLVTDMGECELFSMDSIRTIAQNKKLWPMLSDISKQVTWMGAKHSAETWKHIITAAWKAQVFVQGIGGTLVVIPAKTSRLSKKAFTELIMCIQVFGDEQEVKWSDPSLAAFAEYKEAA